MRQLTSWEALITSLLLVKNAWGFNNINDTLLHLIEQTGATGEPNRLKLLETLKYWAEKVEKGHRPCFCVGVSAVMASEYFQVLHTCKKTWPLWCRLMTSLLWFGRWSSPLSVCRNHSVVAAESSGAVTFKLWPLLVLQRITATCKSEYEIYIYHLFKPVSGSKIGDECSNVKFPRNKLGCLHWLCTCSVWYPVYKRCPLWNINFVLFVGILEGEVTIFASEWNATLSANGS